MIRPAALTLLSFLALVPAAPAGIRGGFFIGAGYGCGPRYYAPPVCVAPRVVYCPSAPVFVYSAPAPVVFARVVRPVYRAPLTAAPVVVSSPSFVWRR